MAKLRRWRKAALLLLPVMMFAGVTISSAAPASADEHNYSWDQLTSWWPYWSQDVCVAHSVRAFNNDATGTAWAETGVGSSHYQNANGLNFSINIGRVLNLGYTPQPHECATEAPVAHGQLLTWMIRYFYPDNGTNPPGWLSCPGTYPQYNPYGGYNGTPPTVWAVNSYDNTAVFDYVRGAGSTYGGCGKGWYLTEAVGIAVQNGAVHPANEPMVVAGGGIAPITIYQY